MEFFRLLYDLLRNLGEDAKWKALVDYVGEPWLYGIMFAIVFAETGLVITPFLPGDSLLFAIGAIGARHEIGINLPLITVLLIVASIVGDAVNYWIGYKLGPAVFKEEDQGDTVDPVTGEIRKRKKSLKAKLLNRDHLLKAQAFYEKYGGKTIILARFVPIVRTFAPFVAGVGKMNYFRFALFNVVGGIAWVLICVGAGYFFGNFAFVKKHFELVIVAIVVISVLPMVVEILRARMAAQSVSTAEKVGSEK